MKSSVCLNHQDRQTTIRCVSCLKPICEECVVAGGDGATYCSQTCADHAVETADRFGEFRRLEEEDRLRQRQRAGRRVVTGLVFLTLLAFALALGWPYLPTSVTGPLQQVYRQWTR